MSSCDALVELRHQMAIAELHARYGELCDQGFPPDEIAALFVEDGVWESSPNGVACRGRSEIAQHFANAGTWYPWSLHINVPLRIVVSDDGTRATGTWYLLMPCVDQSIDVPTGGWIAGRYDNEFEHNGDGWQYRRIRIEFGLMARHTGNWSKDRYSLLNR